METKDASNDSTRAQDSTRVDPSKDSTRVDPSKDSTRVDPGKDSPQVDPSKDSTRVDPSKDSTQVDPGNKDLDNVMDAKDMFDQLHKKALSMGIKQHQMSRLQFVKNARLANRKRLLYHLLQAFLAFSALLVACVITWHTGWPLSRENAAKLFWGIQGTDVLFAESKSCLIKASETVVNLARPPTDCGFCRNVSSVARVENIASSDFEEKYAYTGQPVVISDGADNWTAVNVFSFEFFKGIYKPGSPVLDSQCQFFPYKTDFQNVSHVFQMDENRARLKDGSQPWYIGWSNCDMSAGGLLRQHYSKPYFLPANSESSQTDWIFMGSPGYGAQMHVDNVLLPSWQAQITGHKTWTLESPPECLLECVTRVVVTVHPGEIIVLDTNKWFHSTLVVGEDISITIGSEFD